MDAAHARSNQRYLHVGADLHGLDVLRGLGPVLQLQRVVLGERRPLPPRQLRRERLRMLRDVLCGAEPRTDRVAGPDARDPEAVRPLLSRPHERANFCALAAPDDGAAFAVALARAGTATNLKPVRRADPGALPRSVSRARVRTHGDSNAGAQ